MGSGATVEPVAVVTGAASGIGAAIAAALAERCFRLVLVSLPGDDLEPALSRARSAGVEAVGVPADVRDADALAAVASTAVARFGRVDAVVANAGVVDQSTVAGGDPARWRRVVETNLLGAMLTVRAFLPGMIERGAGEVVLVASASGRDTYVGEPVYIASKWGLVGFGHALRKEVSPFGVRVTLIEPGMVDTPLTRNNPSIRPLLEAADPLQPEDVAAAVVYALSQPRHVVVSELTVRPLRQPDITAIAVPGAEVGGAA